MIHLGFATASFAADGPVPPSEKNWMAARSVVGENVQYKPGKGLVVTSDDGRFSVATRVRVQMLYSLESEGPDLAHDFHIRRARFTLSGHMFGKANSFKMEMAISPNDLGISDNLSDDPDDNTPTNGPMLDYYVQFAHLRDLTVRIGQYKVGYNRQRVISSGDLQLVDRSIANSEFNIDRDLGLDLRSKNLFGLDRLKYSAGTFMGRGRDARGLEPFDMTWLARAEFLPFGMFKDYHEADFARKLSPRLSVGVAYAFQDNNPGLRRVRSKLPSDCAALDVDGLCAQDALTNGTVDTHNAEADLIFKYGGASIQSEFFYRQGSRNPGAAEDGEAAFVQPARNGFGFMAQAGVLVPFQPLEFTARYGMIRGNGDLADLVRHTEQVGFTSLSDNNEASLGINWYFAQHPLKLQSDYTRLWTTSPGDPDGMHRVRVQLQVSN